MNTSFGAERVCPGNEYREDCRDEVSVSEGLLGVTDGFGRRCDEGFLLFFHRYAKYKSTINKTTAIQMMLIIHLGSNAIRVIGF
ncbi:MAG: hypothetical protein HC936_17885 [Leptolyngbyaceae cyanobacterium SU_3_3]|nr:hypothetical protein [Leptolyngbyaceae cyanobacterium SU_3_3]